MARCKEKAVGLLLRSVKRAKRLVAACCAVLVLATFAAATSHAGSTNDWTAMSLQRWAKLRQTEKYQLDIAETYFRKSNYKVAMAEYEKYLKLYERSVAAPYAQLRWSQCLVALRQQNTAIRDGFQSVIDYWPDSPEAVAAAYLTGSTYQGMGNLKKAKKAYSSMLAKYPQHVVSVFTRVNLAKIAEIEKDDKTKVRLWKELTFDVKRDRNTRGSCQQASYSLTYLYFYAGAFKEGKDALATTYKGTSLLPQVMGYIAPPIRSLTGNVKNKAQGLKLADQAIAYLREEMPTNLTLDADKARARQYWFYLANVYGWSNRPKEVPKVYDQMIKQFGVADDILGSIASWLRSQSRRDEARVTYRRFADKANGLSNVAGMYVEEKKWELAINIYRELVALDEKKFATWESQIAYIYRRAGKMTEAIQVYQGLIKRDFDHANAWQWEIATTYRQFGKLKEAIVTYRLCDNFPQNYWEMAECHRALKQYGEALVLYHQIRGGYESWAPKAQLQIGYTYERAGKKEFAIKAFQKVCSRYPQTGEASRSHAHLQNKYNINTGGGGKKGAGK